VFISCRFRRHFPRRFLSERCFKVNTFFGVSVHRTPRHIVNQTVRFTPLCALRWPDVLDTVAHAVRDESQLPVSRRVDAGCQTAFQLSQSRLQIDRVIFLTIPCSRQCSSDTFGLSASGADQIEMAPTAIQTRGLALFNIPGLATATAAVFVVLSNYKCCILQLV